MTSKRLFIFYAVLSLVGLGMAGESPEQFAETVLGVLPVTQTIRLSGGVQKGVQEAYGGRYPGFAVSYWQQSRQRVWALRARGKHGFVHAGLVTQEGRLIQIKILSSKEQRGRMIETPRFLEQFAGAGLGDGATLDQRIDGISGATYSVNAVKKMVRVALYLDSCLE
ncbi:MAG: FMN-binding protein [Verrucomicrobia bacterium]|nr:FMN-binding protein [Verrucomicrobiota bacterium]